MLGQPLGQNDGSSPAALDPHRERPQSAQRQPGLHRSGDSPSAGPMGMQSLTERVASLGVRRDSHAEQHVGVTRKVFGRRVDDDVRAIGQRPLQQGSGKRVVHHHQRSYVMARRHHGRQVRYLEHRVGG